MTSLLQILRSRSLRMVGVLLGLWLGLLVPRFTMPPFIATLGGFLSYRGIGLVLSDARGLSPMGRDFARLGARLPPSLSTGIVIAAGALGLFLIARRERRRRKL